MKYSITYLFFLFLFLSCESSFKTPKETVVAYIAATNRFDIKNAEKLLIPTPANKLNLETLKKMEKSLPDDQKARFLNKEKNAEYFEKTITDSTAQIIVTPNQEVVFTMEFNLKKVNNKWLIESVISH
ncbi:MULTISPECIES: hypothetical protein [Flavobacterium]|uniref:hypothetical protein n=1 Tax=Flavobacterium TaxID=237 RepID=UPI001183EDB6|nr:MULTISPECIES: hypothetical protein [Flavobacterium]MCR4030099.1 hypothetical protein [Flavobacterium panacis]